MKATKYRLWELRRVSKHSLFPNYKLSAKKPKDILEAALNKHCIHRTDRKSEDYSSREALPLIKSSPRKRNLSECKPSNLEKIRNFRSKCKIVSAIKLGNQQSANLRTLNKSLIVNKAPKLERYERVTPKRKSEDLSSKSTPNEIRLELPRIQLVKKVDKAEMADFH